MRDISDSFPNPIPRRLQTLSQLEEAVALQRGKQSREYKVTV